MAKVWAGQNNSVILVDREQLENSAIATRTMRDVTRNGLAASIRETAKMLPYALKLLDDTMKKINVNPR